MQKKTCEFINSAIRSKGPYSKISVTDDDNNNIIESEIPNKYMDYYASTPMWVNLYYIPRIMISI